MTKRSSSFADKIGRNTKSQKESKKGFGYLNLPKDVPVFSVDEDTREVELDILPYEVTNPKHGDRDSEFEIAMPGTLWYRCPVRVHRNVGEKKETVICLKTFGKKCPICEYQDKRRKEKAEKEEIKELYPRSRSIYCVVPLGIKKVDEVPHIWDMSDFLFQDILNDELEADPNNRAFPDLENGKTLRLKLRWKELGDSSYPEVRSITFLDRDPYPEKILKDVPKIDDCLQELTYKQIESKFFDMEDEEDAGEIEETKVEKEAPVEHRRRPVVEEKETSKEDPPARRRRSEPEEEKETRRTRKDEDDPPKRRTVETDNECPHGHTFGKDFEKFKDCNDCNEWNGCYDQSKKR